MVDLAELTPRAFVRTLEELGRRRAFILYNPETGAAEASEPALAEPALDLATAVTSGPDYQAHEGVFLEVGRESRALFGAFIHRTCRGQAQGGLRFWPYATLGAFLRDGLRLAQGMTRKNALAGLWWGGGKGIIARDPEAPFRDPDYRRLVYREYGAFCTSLRGAYLTAEDAGTGPADMAEVFATSRFVTCIPPAVGGSGNPSPATAKGVVCAMAAALGHLGLGSLEGKRIVLQGVGNVGAAMVDELLARRVAAIVASDIREEHLAELRARHPEAPLDLRLASPDDPSILGEPGDVLAPNALGAILNPATIPTIRAKVICGAANNQLLDENRDAAALAARGVVYIPDFLANRMGIVSCANEQYGYVTEDPAIQRHFDPTWENSLPRITQRTLRRAEAEGITPAAAAIAIADELACERHPIWGHRSRAILGSLRAEAWHRDG